MSSSPRAIISPSVLASNFADLGNEIKRMMHCGAEWVHMGRSLSPSSVLFPTHLGLNRAPTDVMDGHFVPNITMGPPVLASVHKTVDNVFMDCHMMVSDPARVRYLALLSRPVRSGLSLTDSMMGAQWVKPVAEAGGKSYTFHIEALEKPELAHELVDLIHSTGMRAAVAISPDTPSSAITDALGESVDMLLVMTVVPGPSPPLARPLTSSDFCETDGGLWYGAGAGGQKFMERCIPKVAELRTRFPTKDIQVDGGVGPGTVGCCARA
ncbi:SPOSA6832_05137, partial [Sporobolomyces salmonicolor]